MKMVLGPIPTSRTLRPVVGIWTPLSNSDSASFTALATSLAMVPVVIGLLVLFSDNAATILRFREDKVHFGVFVACLVMLVPMHELIHAVAYFKPLRSPQMVVGVWPRRCMCYVVYDEPLPRFRVLLMSISPFLILTCVPALVLFWIDPPFRSAVAFVVLVHTSLCAGDALVVWRLLAQVPPGALVHNDGWTTYWKLPAPESPA